MVIGGEMTFKFGDHVRLAKGYDYGSIDQNTDLIVVGVDAARDEIDVAAAGLHYCDMPTRMFVPAVNARIEVLEKALKEIRQIYRNSIDDSPAFRQADDIARAALEGK
jgi:hypothetical protein